MVSALKSINLTDIHHFTEFAADLAKPAFPYRYVFIEPSYDVPHDYRDGASQHPLGDVNGGEALIKATYEAIRGSACWESSLLVVIWDEHGGFYDHAVPPDAVAPGDTAPNSPHNQNGFTFEKYGPRVPALAISPLVPKNVIDHRLYDHSSVPATLADLFGLGTLTRRDAAANRLTSLLTLSAARQDAPQLLPPVASEEPAPLAAVAAASASPAVSISRPGDSANGGNLSGILQGALRQDLAVSPPSERPAIIARVRSIKTGGEAIRYMNEVQRVIAPLRAASASAP